MNVGQYVEKKAYFRWLDRGGLHGDDLKDWLEAEQRIPEVAQLGWRPFRMLGDFHCKQDRTPALLNWRDFLTGPRRCAVDRPCYKVYQTVAWVNEYDAMHSDGHPPIPRERLAADIDGYEEAVFEAPYPFPSPESLQERDTYVQFYGPVLVLWIVRISYQKVVSVEYEFQRHPDTICEEIPRSEVPFRCLSSSGVRDFPLGMVWRDSHFDHGVWR